MSKLPLLTEGEGEIAYQAAQCVVRTHERLVEFLRVGQTLGVIDAFVARTLADLGCRSCFLGYKVPRSPAFPSHACLSVNECVVHGTAGYYTKPLVEGDVLKIDIGVWHKGFIGDAAWTYAFKHQTPEAKRLMDAGKESLALGCEQLRVGNTYLKWAQAVQGCVEERHGLHLIRGLGGHGIGRSLHGPPFVSNVVPTYPGEWPEAMSKCLAGTVIAVEPMLAIGTGATSQTRNQWPVFTADGSLSAHYEHDVLIREKGPWILTEGLEKMPDVVG